MLHLCLELALHICKHRILSRPLTHLTSSLEVATFTVTGNFGLGALCRLRSLPEVLDLAMQSEQKGRRIGVYIETKDPTFHDRVGLPLEERVIHTLVKAGYKETLDAPVILQSFEEPVQSPDSSFSDKALFLYRQINWAVNSRKLQ